MWIEVRSPHNGRPVRVRDKDVGRTVRDGDGAIFYALPTADGKGHYGSLTRTGGPEQERRYFEMIAKEDDAKGRAADVTRQQIHDATGKRRPSKLPKLAVLVILLVLAVVAYLYLTGKLSFGGAPAPPPTPNSPSSPATTPNAGSSARPAQGVAFAILTVPTRAAGGAMCPGPSRDHTTKGTS